MRLSRCFSVIALAASGLVLAGCGGGTTGSSAPPSPVQTASTESASQHPATQVTPHPPGTTCDDFQAALTDTTGSYQHLRMARGTDIEYQSVLGDLTADMATFDALAPDCARKAVAVLAALSTATAEVVSAYPPNTADSDLTAGNEALDAMEGAGRAAWRKLGVATYGWDYVQQ